jgi:hypothetical protein
MSDDSLAVTLFGLIVLIFIIWWTVFQWGICREAGLPFWYCVQHIL